MLRGIHFLTDGEQQHQKPSGDAKSRPVSVGFPVLQLQPGVGLLLRARDRRQNMVGAGVRLLGHLLLVAPGVRRKAGIQVGNCVGIQVVDSAQTVFGRDLDQILPY